MLRGVDHEWRATASPPWLVGNLRDVVDGVLELVVIEFFEIRSFLRFEIRSFLRFEIRSFLRFGI